MSSIELRFILLYDIILDMPPAGVISIEVSPMGATSVQKKNKRH